MFSMCTCPLCMYRRPDPPSLRTPLLSCIRSDSRRSTLQTARLLHTRFNGKQKGSQRTERERRGTEAREPIPQPAPPSPNEHNRSSPTSPGAKRSIPHVLFLYFAYIYDTLPFQPVFSTGRAKSFIEWPRRQRAQEQGNFFQSEPRALTPRSPRF